MADVCEQLIADMGRRDVIDQLRMDIQRDKEQKALRDRFAERALCLGMDYFHAHAAYSAEQIAIHCYQIADEMLKQREVTSHG